MKSALVTGASRGIGRAIAFALAEKRYGLTVTSRSSTDLAQLAGDLLSAGAADVSFAAADMGDVDAVRDLVNVHAGAFGTMQALVINAGTGTAGRVREFRMDRLQRTLDVNFRSALHLIQESLPLLQKYADAAPGDGSKVVAVASITGQYAEPGLAVYGASKAALLSLVDTLNAEESGNGISATAIAPGYVDTDMAAWVTDRIPAASMIRASDVASVVTMVLGLSATATIPRIVMSRAGSSGYEA